MTIKWVIWKDYSGSKVKNVFKGGKIGGGKPIRRLFK